MQFVSNRCKDLFKQNIYIYFGVRCSLSPGGGGGVLPYKRLLGMCRWMGSHFYDWTDYNGAAFLVELLEWDSTFLGFLG